MRYEITGTATDIWTVEEVQTALRAVKAMAVSKRRAFGMANQPYVATFLAIDYEEARKVCSEARKLLPRNDASLPGLFPSSYGHL